MLLHPLPTDNLLEKDGKPSVTWDNWLTRLRDLTNNGQPPSKDTNVIAADGIEITSDHMRIQSITAGAIVISADPQMSAGKDGQSQLIEGLSGVKTVGIVDGKGLSLTGGASFVFAEGDTMTLHFNKAANLWIESSRSKK